MFREIVYGDAMSDDQHPRQCSAIAPRQQQFERVNDSGFLTVIVPIVNVVRIVENNVIATFAGNASDCRCSNTSAAYDGKIMFARMPVGYARSECVFVPRTLHHLADLAYYVFRNLFAIGDDHKLEGWIETKCKRGKAD
jgi:hypothetical protein